MTKRANLSETSDAGTPSVIDPWIISQFGKYARQTWVTDKLSDIYTKDVIDLKLGSLEKSLNSRLDSLEKDSDNTQRVFVEQRGKWSLIPKRHEVEDLKTAVTGWSSWFRRVIIGVILFLVGTGGTAVWQYAELNMAVGAARNETDKVLKDYNELKIIQEEQRKTMEFMKTIIQNQRAPVRTDSTTSDVDRNFINP